MIKNISKKSKMVNIKCDDCHCCFQITKEQKKYYLNMCYSCILDYQKKRNL